MREKGKRLLVAGIAGAVGGALGAVSASSSWVVVACVSAAFAVFVAWGINSVLK